MGGSSRRGGAGNVYPFHAFDEDRAEQQSVGRFSAKPSLFPHGRHEHGHAVDGGRRWLLRQHVRKKRVAGGPTAALLKALLIASTVRLTVSAHACGRQRSRIRPDQPGVGAQAFEEPKAPDAQRQSWSEHRRSVEPHDTGVRVRAASSRDGVFGLSWPRWSTISTSSSRRPMGRGSSATRPRQAASRWIRRITSRSWTCRQRPLASGGWMSWARTFRKGPSRSRL